MAVNIVTVEDLHKFRDDLIIQITNLLAQKQQLHQQRKWLKSHEVRRLLLISPGTLQTLRINGKLPFTKIGGIIYYNHDDIQTLLQTGSNDKQRSIFNDHGKRQ